MTAGRYNCHCGFAADWFSDASSNDTPDDLADYTTVTKDRGTYAILCLGSVSDSFGSLAALLSANGRCRLLEEMNPTSSPASVWVYVHV